MASSQQLPASTSILQNEDTTVVEQMMKEAEKILLSNNPNVEKMQLQIAGCILNITKGSRLHIHNKHDWSGQVSFRAEFPTEIPIGGTAKFVHYGAPSKGSKAAVVYASVNCAWLLAWYVPFGDEPNKVYVENGAKENYNVIDWYEIERKLEASGNMSVYEDVPTRCKSIAELNGDGKKVKLGAMFLNG
ncbi:jasmonate-induced protein homolog [Chenopodium quinoa]|uniref:Uncharacterized protein n=1 Tax=Chenopodium quinoa TaxID=63459 RepID=A0A803KS08_CHEQI|nr:jasmonate-induced protein homolog [Chenopodium quinoa]